MSKLMKYSAVSLTAASLVIGEAIYTHKQFYTTVVYLTTAKLSRVLLMNAAVVLTLLFGQAFRWIFFGKLKPRETEKAHEQTFYHVATTCLALTIFREHITALILTQFVLCLFVKIFHWLAASREEFVEQISDQRNLSIRLCFLLITLGTIDVIMSAIYVAHFLEAGPSVRLLLALEYLVLSVSCFSTFARLCLHFLESTSQYRWEERGKYGFYLEIGSDLIQSILYMAFFCIILYCYGIPIHLVRELFITLRSFKKTISDFLRYRKLVEMIDRYEDATPEEIAVDPQCIVCQYDMTEAKKLPCKHLFHKHCLKKWMERQQDCPYCRRVLLTTVPETMPREENAPVVPAPAVHVGEERTEVEETESKKDKGKKDGKTGLRQRKVKKTTKRREEIQSMFNDWQGRIDAMVAATPQGMPAVKLESTSTVKKPDLHLKMPSKDGDIDSDVATAGSSCVPNSVKSPAIHSDVATAGSSSDPMTVLSSLSQGLGTTFSPFAGTEGLQFPQNAATYTPFGAGIPSMGMGMGYPPMGYTPMPQGMPSPDYGMASVPCTPQEAKAYAVFHNQMGRLYEDMASNVKGMAEAYAKLAEDLAKLDSETNSTPKGATSPPNSTSTPAEASHQPPTEASENS